MQVSVKLGAREWRTPLWGLALLAFGGWMLITYGEAALDGFIAGLTGQPPR